LSVAALDGARISEELQALETLNIDGLRERWRLSFGMPPMIHSGEMMRYLLAEKLQEQVYGVDRELKAKLKQLAAQSLRGEKPKAPAARFRPGTQLVREWQGQTYLVEVVDGGFRLNDQRFRSLSEIARFITGTRWNGPLFFGLRDRPKDENVRSGKA
jgi:hypothetical protein